MYSEVTAISVYSNQAWYLGINDMISNSRLIGTPTVTQNHLFTHPKTVDQFNQYFSSSETDYTLEPGQSIEENIEGPSMLYDGGKFWQSGNYCIHQKQDIYSFVVYWYDLCVGLVPTVNLVGYINEASGSTDGLLVRVLIIVSSICQNLLVGIPLVSFLQLALSIDQSTKTLLL